MDPDQTKIYAAILIASAVLGIIVIYFIFSIVKNQRKHLELQQSNLLLEITTLENERKRIVADLHDELGPLLSVVKFQVQNLETENEENLQLIENAGKNLDVILERIRSICHHLMPQVLLRKGLILAIREFISELDNITPIDFEFNCEADVIIPSRAEIHLFRIVQEIVYNAIKHASASEISINLAIANRKLTIIISDNGKGFNPDKIESTRGGFGLKNILSRVDVLLGDMYLSSNPGKGTTFTIEIPTT